MACLRSLKKTFGHWSLMLENAETENALAIELLKTEHMEDGNIKIIVQFLVMDTKKYPDLRNIYICWSNHFSRI